MGSQTSGESTQFPGHVFSNFDGSGGSEIFMSSNTYNDGKWHQVLVTMDVENEIGILNTYVDNALTRSASYFSSNLSLLPEYISIGNVDSHPYTGYLRDFKLYNDIDQIDLVGDWPTNSNVVSGVIDDVVGNNDFQIQGNLEFEILDTIIDVDECCFDIENDIDGDGICGCTVDDCNLSSEDIDECPYDANDDIDNDGTCGCTLDDCSEIDNVDECPLDPDNDIDDDGICGDDDFCPLDADNDIDGDEICGDVDICPEDFYNDEDDDDICGDVDLCPQDDQNDADGDGICGNVDDCPFDANNDEDDDGICGDVDLCPRDQENDADDDGICGDIDECPYDAENDIDNDGLCCNINYKLEYLEFDGNDDYIDVPDLGQYNNFTIEFNIKNEMIYEQVSSYRYGGIFGTRDWGTGKFALQIIGNNDYGDDDNWGDLYNCDGCEFRGGISSVVNGGSAVISQTNFHDEALNEWTNVAITYEANNKMKLYINGNIENESNAGDVAVDFSNLSIGDLHTWDERFFKGALDEFRIWNKVLSNEEIQQNLQISPEQNNQDLVAYWKFDATADNILSDYSGNGYYGVMYGPQWVEFNVDVDDVCCDDLENDADNDDTCGCTIDECIGDIDECPYDAEDDRDNDGLCGCTLDDCSEIDNIDDCPYDAENDSDNDGTCGCTINECSGDIDECPYDPDNDIDNDGYCCNGGESACGIEENTIFLTPSGDVFYNVPTDFAGIQFDVNGSTINSASGGESELVGWTIESIGSTVLGFSLANTEITSDCGLLFNLELNNEALDLVNILFVDINSNVIDVSYFDKASDLCCDDPENDVDGDFVCGNIDTCPYDNPDDTDGDGICDSNDICPGGDDNQDSDGDGIPDDCEVFGCTDESAANYSSNNTEEDFSCFYSYDLDYHVGANLVSFYVLPDTSSYVDAYHMNDFIFNNFENVEGVIGQNSSALIQNDIIYGSLVNIDRLSGYWFKFSEDETDVKLTGFKTPGNIEFSLIEGNNLVSFPSDSKHYIDQIIPENLAGVITAIIGEGKAAMYVDGQWYGFLEELEGFRGYWMTSLLDVDFSYNFSDNAILTNSNSFEEYRLDGYEYNQSSSQAFYFIKDIPEANIGDWIIAYHNDVIIGKRKWMGEMIDIPVMGYDESLYSIGYIEEGEKPVFKLYDSLSGKLIDLYGELAIFNNNAVTVVDYLTTNPNELLTDISLSNAYPNPFNPKTSVSFTIPYNMEVSVNLIDIQGRLVQTIANGMYLVGTHNLVVDGFSLSSGVYFIQLITDEKIEYQKIMLLK